MRAPCATLCNDIHERFEVSQQIFTKRSDSAKSETEITEVWDGRENSQILAGSRSLTEDNIVT